jgi:hypothetical protein
MDKPELAALIINALRKEVLEAQKLERADHDHDFNALVASIIDDLATMQERFSQLATALYAEQPGLYTFSIWLEEADGSLPKQHLGTVKADTFAQAVEKGAEIYGYPEHDLIASQFYQTRPPGPQFPLASGYQPEPEDIYVVKLWFDQYTVKRYNGSKWEPIANSFTDATIIKDIEGLHAQYIGDKHNRQYYRPQLAGEEPGE